MLRSAAMRTVMMTGDYQLTSVAVARSIGMVPPGGRVVIILSRSESLNPKGALKSAKLASTPASARAVSWQSEAQDPIVEGVPARAGQGLMFQLDNGDPFENGDSTRALTAIAQGQAQCCITGPAFEHLLQQADVAALDVVMRNAVVFARMQSQQKAQALQLFSVKGLHQMLHGTLRHIPGLGKAVMYCGDGINDLAALAVADVGMAISSSNAAAAATVCDRHASVAGICAVLKQARATQVIKLSAIKYMITYQLLLSLARNVTFFGGSLDLSSTQKGAFDFIALSLGVIASLRPASEQLLPVRPSQTLNHVKNMMLVFETLVISGLMYWACLHLLKIQSWVSTSTGKPIEGMAVTVIWVVGFVQVLVPVLSFSVDTHPFCKSVSWPELGLIVFYMILTTVSCLLGPGIWDAAGLLHLCKLPISFGWKFELVALSFATVYIVVFTLTRRLDKHYRQCQVLPHNANHAID
ncbi:TPA: hypothetical protein ACH3X2_006236 [Trebouxia sp. C0005]